MIKKVVIALVFGLIVWAGVSIPWDETRYWDFSEPFDFDDIGWGPGEGIPEQIERAREGYFDQPFDPSRAVGADYISRNAREHFFSLCEESLTPIRQRAHFTGTAVVYECEVDSRTVELRVCRYLAWDPLMPNHRSPIEIAGQRLDIIIYDAERPAVSPWLDRFEECVKYSIF